jgi:hypothetical protein
MLSFLWQLMLGAGREVLADWGTSPLGWLLIFVIPVGVLAVKALRAEKGKVRAEVLENWREEIRDVFVVTLACSALIFSYELFREEPVKIWREADGIQLPPLLFRDPPSIASDSGLIPTPKHTDAAVPVPFVKEETFMTLIPFPISEGAVSPAYRPDLTRPFDPQEGAVGNLAERYDRLISLGIQAMQSRDNQEPWNAEQIQESLSVALQYYIIRQVDALESGAIGVVVVGAGKTETFVTSGIRPPDEVRCPGDQVVRAIYPNRLSRTDFEKKWWGAGYRLPRSTKITLHDTVEKGRSPTLSTRIENPRLYFMEIAIASDFGPSNNLPFGYRPYPGLDMSKINTFPYTIKCHFEFKRRLDTDNLQEEEYAKWADDLFLALKKNLAN